MGQSFGGLFIGRNWSWSGSYGGDDQESGISDARGTCAVESVTFSSSVGVTGATWEVVATFSWEG